MEDKERLFRLVSERAGNVPDAEIIAEIKADSGLLAVSGSYCVQCGNCCNTRCLNKEVRDGKTYCLLHDLDGWPNGRKVPEYGAVTLRVLDANLWVKPEVCHTYGPH
jgi:hypothetical protein